jgi:hypothetical protein
MKHQAQVALDKASKSHDLIKQVSNLQDEVSSLVARIAHFEECESFLIGIVESVCEMLLCKSSGVLFLFCFALACCVLTFTCTVGTCLDLAGESRRVSERIAALQKAAQETESLWSNLRRCRAIGLLQDRAQHIGEAVDGCRMSLTAIYSVMLPRNAMPREFRQLLETFRTSQRVHLLIKLNLIVGANFSLGWM